VNVGDKGVGRHRRKVMAIKKHKWYNGTLQQAATTLMSLCHDVIIISPLSMAPIWHNLPPIFNFLQETGHESNILCNFATKI